MLAQSIKNSDGSIKYLNINSLIEYAESGGVATASDFDGIAVYFGKANNGTGEELAWIPAYVSKDINGNVILTLWLATTETKNSTDTGKLQEVSKFSDGTSSDQRTSPWPSSNNYSTSYIRAMINNGGLYYGNWNGTYDPSAKALDASDSNKFAMYATGGALSNYITVPADMSWQKDAGYLIGDPKYTNDNYDTFFKNNWSSADWLNDKLWLPSVYELYKKEIPTTDINSGIFDRNTGCDGGLWKTTAGERMANNTWLRTGFIGQDNDNITHNYVFILSMNGSIAQGDVKSVIANSVRPALHLNLSAVLDTLTPKVSVTIGGGTSDPSPTEYTSLASAWQAATAVSSATVKLLEDIETSSTLEVTSGKNIKLDLNGHMLSLKSGVEGSVIKVDGGSLILDDSEKNMAASEMTPHTVLNLVSNLNETVKGGVISGGNNTSNGGCVFLTNNAKFTMKAGTIFGNKCPNSNGGGVAAIYGSEFIMEGGTICGNSASGGGGVYVSGLGNGVATFKMTGGLITGNSSGVRAYGGNFEVSGDPKIKNNMPDDAAYNIQLQASKITVVGALSKGAEIYIGVDGNVATGYTFNGNDKPSKYFKPDNELYDCVYVSDKTTGAVTIGTHSYSGSECSQCGDFRAASVSIGGVATNYSTLEEAWAVANGDGVSQSNPATVTMFADAKTQETLVVKSGKQITLVLNGHKLEFAGASGSVIRVEGMFKAQHLPDGDYGIVSNTVKNPNDDYKEVTINYSVITGGKGTEQQSDGKTVTLGGGVFVAENGEFILGDGVAIAGNTADFGGGVRVDKDATFTMQDSAEISYNRANIDGGGLCVCNAQSIFLAGVIQSNAAANGGGVYLQSGGLTITGGGINNNKAENGGGVYVELGEFTMTGGSIYLNEVTAGGGGVYIKNGAFEMSDGEIYSNQAANGGGIYSLEARNFTISGDAAIGKPYIQKSSSLYEWGNTAEYGGGVFLRGGTFTMNGGKIQYNCATMDGGGLYVDSGSTFDMSGGDIANNDADRNGGGVFYYGTQFNVSGDAVIADNTKGSAGNNVFLGGENSKITVAGAIDALLIYVHNTGAVITGLTSEKYSNAHDPSDFFHADSMADNCVWMSNWLIGEATIGHNYNADGVCTECGSTKQIYWGISEDGTLILSGSVSDITSDEVNRFDFNQSFASSSAPWFSQADSIKRIVIKDGVAPTKMTFWFRYLSNVEAIDMSGLDASNVTDMASLFNGCSKLTEIIFPEVFDTSKLTDMNAMFYGCSSLTYVDVPQFDTSHVYNMYGLFGNCSSLTSIDLSSFDISRCTDLNDMFKGCTALMTIKAPSTVGTKEAPLSAAFADSEGNAFTSLTSAAEGKTLTKITKQYWGVFDDGKTLIISGLESDVQGAQSKGSFDIDAQFSLSDSAPWSDFKNSIKEVTITKGVAPKSTAYWFYGFDKLATVDMLSLHLTKDTDTNAMLDGCTALMTVNAPLHIGVIIVLPATFVTFDKVELDRIIASVAGETLTKAIKIYWGVFDEGKTLIISGLESDVQNATENGNFYFDFEFDPSQYGHKVPWGYCAMDIEQVRIINGVAPKYMSRWFMDFNKLVDIDFSGLDTSNVVSMESMFYNCTSLTSLDLSNFNTEKVTDMRNMFCGCAKLTSLDISSFDMSNLTAASIEGEDGNQNMVLMFEHCDKLNTIKAPKKMNDMFALMPAKHVDEFTLVSVNFWNGTNDVTVLSKTSVGKTLIRHDGHSYSWVSVSDATCTQAGSQKQVCSVCGAEGDTKSVAALGHSWGEPVWTWSADGKTASAKFTCSHDGTHVNTLNATITSAVKTAATCEAMGTTTYTAKVTLDGREYTSTKDVTDIAKLAHSFGEWHETILPTCSEAGRKGYKDCLLCHKHFDADGEEIAELTIAIDENAHSYGEWHEMIAPTCSEAGTKGYKDCLLCHKYFDADGEEITELTVAIDENAHSFGEWTVTKESTLDEFGEKKRICAHNEAHEETVQIPKRVAQLVKPDGNGGADEVIITIPDGFAPDIELVVTEISQDNFDRYQDIAKAANGEIGLVYDVTLKSNGVSVQPDGTLTIKLRIPQNLKGKTFKLFHLHDGEATDMEYTVEGDYAVVSTDTLSEFVFVGEAETHSASNTVWIVLISILAVIVAAEIGYIVYQEVRKKKATEGRI